MFGLEVPEPVGVAADNTAAAVALSTLYQFDETKPKVELVAVSYTHLDVYKRQLEVLCKWIWISQSLKYIYYF